MCNNGAEGFSIGSGVTSVFKYKCAEFLWEVLYPSNLHLFFMVGRRESFTTMSCRLNKGRSDSPTSGWAPCTATAQHCQRQPLFPGSPSYPAPLIPAPQNFHPHNTLRQWKAHLLYFLYVTDSKPRYNEIRLPAQGPLWQGWSCTSASQIPSLTGGLFLASLLASPSVSPAPWADQTSQVPQG